MNILIGIDDTDNLESRGTGYLARFLGESIEKEGLGTVINITRHQLFVDPRIPYTSHNSSACLELEETNLAPLKKFCGEFLLKHAAQGSDAGLVICPKNHASSCVQDFGMRAKKQIVLKTEAENLSSRNAIYLEGFTGKKIGVIGALAGVGLKAYGFDGRFLYLRGKKNFRELSEGILTAFEIIDLTNIQEIRSLDDEVISGTEKVYLHDWTRPVLNDHKPVLFVEKNLNEAEYEWRTASREYLKSIS